MKKKTEYQEQNHNKYMKHKIKILVEQRHEMGEDFGNRIQTDVLDKIENVNTVICIPTSSSDGRQTMTIQWQEQDRVGEPLFNFLDIMNVIKDFNEKECLTDEEYMLIKKLELFMIQYKRK